MPEERRGLDWTLKDVQLAVDKNVLSLTTARHVASVAGLDGRALRDSPTGYCWEDERRNYLIRAKVIYEALEAYAPAKNAWLDDSRARSYRILEGLARDIVRTLKHA
jgi:hypothetical protein